jgi:hypothetical protein
MRTIAAAVVFVVGVAMLMGGAVAQQIWLGVLGFVVMVGSATIGLAAWRGRHAPTAQPQHSEDRLFDFDDHPHRFDVIDGGRSGKSRKLRRQSSSRPARRPRPMGKSPKQGTFMQRMEQRWERRRHQGYCARPPRSIEGRPPRSREAWSLDALPPRSLTVAADPCDRAAATPATPGPASRAPA